jgi:predicted dehydrogenase
METVRLAILGAGFSAAFRAQAYGQVPGAEVVSVLCRRPEAVRGTAFGGAARYLAPTFDALLAGPPFDAVDICLPNHLHRPYAVLAAQHGKHVICQKPLGRNAEEAREMLAAVEAAGVLHCYGENWLFSPDMREIEDILRQGVIGRPVWIRGREAHSGPHARWFYDRTLAGGGALLDMGCHVIGVINALLGCPARDVLCHTATLVHATACEDNAVAVVRYENGVVGQVEASWTQRGGMTAVCEIWGEDGMITYDRSGPSQPIKVFSTKDTGRYFMEKAEPTRGWLFPIVEEPWRYGYVDELRHCIDAIRAGRPPRLTFRDGLEVNRIIDAGYASAAAGTRVALGGRLAP